MTEMVRAERKKILSKRSTVTLFFISIIIIVIYFILFIFSYRNVYYDYENGIMKSVGGYESIEQRKAIANLFTGELTQDTLSLIQNKLAIADNATFDKDETTQFSAHHVYRDQKTLLDFMTNENGSFKTIAEAYPNSTAILLGYCDGWDNMLSSMGEVLSILVCLIITISISPVFAEEYVYHTDSVICSARYGKNKLVVAKILASIQVMVGIYGIYLLFHILLFGCIYGFNGWGVSIQSSLHYGNSTYALTFGQLFLSAICLNLLGIITLTVITLFISAKMHSPVSALILACVVCFLPVFFDFTDNISFFQKIQEVCPIFLLNVNTVFAKAKQHAGLDQPIIMTAINGALIVIFYILTKHACRNHQVT